MQDDRKAGHRMRAGRWVAAVAAAALAFSGALLTAAPATAGIAVHGYGYTWAGDGTSFIGSYKVNGYLAYCDQVAAGPGTNFNYNNPDWTPSGTGWSTATKAKLAYLMRTYGSSTNNTTAAAVGLNIWRITGMNGHTDDYYATRANGYKDAVIAAANAQRSDMNANATTAVRASTSFVIPTGQATGTVSTKLEVDKLSGWTTVPAGRWTGKLTLTGGVFTDTGLTTRNISNGGTYGVTAQLVNGVYLINGSVTFSNLPYGNTVGVMTSTSAGRQPLLVAGNRTVSATGAAKDPLAGNADIPFQLAVTTQASDDVAAPGEALTDTMDVSVVATTANPTADWSTYGVTPDTAPVPVTIRSQLWGPFDAAPDLAGTVPTGANEVCEVSQVVTAEGEYTSAPCTPPDRGYYVWTESIDPNDTAFGQGRSQIIAFTSTFGDASETTLVPWQPAATTTASTTVASAGSCVSDTIAITGTQPGVDVNVDSQLWGPFDAAPAVGSTIDTTAAPEVGIVSTTINGNGTYTTDCQTITTPGFYVWTYQSAGSGAALPFGSYDVFAGESTLIQWQPAVITTASQQSGLAGSCVSDTMVVSGMQPGDNLPVTSDLWGPFTTPPAVGSAIDTTTATDVGSSVVTAAGDGSYTTACQVLPASGYYVFTEAAPGDATNLTFGSTTVVDTETTLAKWAPAVTTAVDLSTGMTGTCVADGITVTGMQPGGSVDVTSEAWGPFKTAPVVGSSIDTSAAHLAGSSTFNATGNGTHTAPCLALTAPGYYVYTYRSAGNATIAPFSSTEVFSTEMASITAPPPVLAFTNAVGTASAFAAGISALGSGVVLAAYAVWYRRRRPGPNSGS